MKLLLISILLTISLSDFYIGYSQYVQLDNVYIDLSIELQPEQNDTLQRYQIVMDYNPHKPESFTPMTLEYKLIYTRTDNINDGTEYLQSISIIQNF